MLPLTLKKATIWVQPLSHFYIRIGADNTTPDFAASVTVQNFPSIAKGFVASGKWANFPAENFLGGITSRSLGQGSKKGSDRET
jgi:hypothetical protein